jgi:hypothetical protein
MTTEELQAKRDLLVARIADGVKSTSFGDKSVTYADIAGMQQALAVLDGEIAAASSTRTSRVVLVQHSNG